MDDDDYGGNLFEGPPPPPPLRPGHQPSDQFHDDDTLADVRRRVAVLRTRPHGVECPTCGQPAEEHGVPINKSMTRGLIACFRAASFGFYRPREILWDSACQYTDHAKLRHWGLIIAPTDTQMLAPGTVVLRRDAKAREFVYVPITDYSRRGTWHVTELGAEFIYGRVSVPHRAMLYNRGGFYGFVDETDRVKVAQVLPLDVDMLLSGVPPYGYWLDD